MAQDNQRGFFGIIIPREILDDEELSIAEKFIYGYVASFSRCCFESNEAIGDKLGLSESTVHHAIPKLVNKGYFYVEKVNNSNNARRIYSVLDNPKKLAYLSRKGMFKVVENSQPVGQNLPNVGQNLPNDLTGVRRAKFADIDKEENKNKVNQPAPAVEKPSRLAQVRRSDFDDPLDYEKAFYERNTHHFGAV